MADYTQLLAEMVDNKGAPGNTRTKATWAAYRMRQKMTPRGLERVILAAYRTLGYGERAGPPFLMWGIGVVICWLVTMFTRPLMPSWEGLKNVANLLGYWAVPSVALINQPQLPDVVGLSHNVWAFLVHTLLAIPFLTGVLALRNFVKADRPNR